MTSHPEMRTVDFSNEQTNFNYIFADFQNTFIWNTCNLLLCNTSKFVNPNVYDGVSHNL